MEEGARVRRTGLPRRRRLHGPRKLGHRSRGRRAVWVHTADRHPAVQLDGDSVAGARRKARHRERPRSGAGVPRSLLAARVLFSVDHLRDRDRRVRSRRGHRLGHRPESLVRHPAGVGHRHHVARCADRALHAAQGIPAARGAGRRADCNNRRLLPVRDPDCEARCRRRACRLPPERDDPERPRQAVHRDRHPRRDRDAPQPLSPLVRRADPQLRGDARRQTRGGEVRFS